VVPVMKSKHKTFKNKNYKSSETDVIPTPQTTDYTPVLLANEHMHTKGNIENSIVTCNAVSM